MSFNFSNISKDQITITTKNLLKMDRDKMFPKKVTKSSIVLTTLFKLSNAKLKIFQQKKIQYFFSAREVEFEFSFSFSPSKSNWWFPCAKWAKTNCRISTHTTEENLVAIKTTISPYLSFLLSSSSFYLLSFYFPFFLLP